jgi:hypothetical protein
VNGDSELNGTVDVNGQLIAESSSVIPLTRSGLTAGSGVTTVIQAIAKYTSTPSAGDGPTIALVADDGAQQTVAAIWGKKVDATSGRLELREQTTGSLVLSAHTENGRFFTDKTEWHYFDVSPYINDAAAYVRDSAANPAYIYTTTDSQCVTIPIHYEPGTIITRISVRSQGVGAGDGAKLSLDKRHGGTAAAAWAVVGAQQTYTGAEANNVYDIPDETMTADYGYRIRVVSQHATTQERIWEVGVETGERAY